jgi:hypothetical protein
MVWPFVRPLFQGRTLQACSYQAYGRRVNRSENPHVSPTVRLAVSCQAGPLGFHIDEEIKGPKRKEASLQA